jgi:hypothetical protein
MLTICTVLRSGGEFKPEHVYTMQDMCYQYIKKHEFTFQCLSNLQDLNCNTINLSHNWPKWWSKIELFNITFLK